MIGSYREAKKKFDREYFLNLTKSSNGSVSNMGYISGLSRTTILNQLGKLKIIRVRTFVYTPKILNNKKDK